MYKTVSKLSQAAAPSEERNEHLPVMENPARNEVHATQQAKKKQRGNRGEFRDLHARNDACEKRKQERNAGAGSTAPDSCSCHLLLQRIYQSAFFRINVGTSRSSTRAPIIGRGRSSAGRATKRG